MPYKMEFAGSVKAQLGRLNARDRVLVLDTIERQLLHEPSVETRNRKPLRPNPLAPWELRIGELRVFYDVGQEEKTVYILAVGEKRGSSLWIEGQEVKL